MIEILQDPQAWLLALYFDYVNISNGGLSGMIEQQLKISHVFDAEQKISPLRKDRYGYQSRYFGELHGAGVWTMGKLSQAQTPHQKRALFNYRAPDLSHIEPNVAHHFYRVPDNSRPISWKKSHKPRSEGFPLLSFSTTSTSNGLEVFGCHTVRYSFRPPANYSVLLQRDCLSLFQFRIFL